ncbi:MAG: GNAT family N-acetyltransferase [Intrasporangium sp.]|uniref:GNAT family N-acetyltransferase n=1 Tax=Intrasporangium sp. TaxID=1925024 RepID=UPI003F7ECB0B
MEIRRLDTTDRDELKRWYEACLASVRAVQPTFVPKPFEEHLRKVLEPELGAERYDLVAVEDGVVLGGVMIYLPMEDNREIVWLVVDVDPAHRRRGVGRALVAAAEAEVPADRHEFIVPANVPADQVSDHPYRRFAESVGYAVSTVSTERARAWPVDRARLDELAVSPAGYRLESYVDGVPEAYRPSLGVLKGLIDVDAPTGDIEWEASPVSPEHYAEELRRHVASGRRLVESVALDASGGVVAYSEIVVPSVPERHMTQEGTLVRSDHRGHRLGLAVKVANLQALLDLEVKSPSIRTGNDDANRHMIAINEQLGFVPDLAEIAFVKRR